MTSIFSPTLPKEGYNTDYWQGLNGSAESLALVHAATRAEGPILLICDNNESVEKYLRELSYLSSELNAYKIFALPDWETLPYDNFSPHQDIISDRLATLSSLPRTKHGVVVTSVSSLMHLLPPRQYIDANSLDLATGQKRTLTDLREQMAIAGYQHVTSVMEHGEFAVRGSIVDIFPMGTALPLRIDLFDDEIDSIRRFDPETQRSASKVERIILLPGREFPLDEPGVMQFRQRFRERFDVDIRRCPIYQDVSDGIASPGIEYYLHVFFEKLDSLFDFLPDNATICKVGNLRQAGEKFWADITDRYEDRRFDRYRPILPPEQVFIPVNELFSRLKSYRQVEFKAHPQAISFSSEPLPDLASNSRAATPLGAIKDFVDTQPGRILFTAETAGRRETLLELFKQVNINPLVFDHWQQYVNSKEPLGITIAQIDRGFWLTDEDLLLIPEAQIFRDRVAQRRRRKRVQSNTEFIIKSLTELHVDDPVVHLEHGVGRYRGLQTITTEGEATEYLTLEYADQAKLYVPVSALHLISRYSGADQHTAPLNTLGTDQWQRTKRKAAEKIHDVAAELLEIYAAREAREGFQYSTSVGDYQKFAASFPFEETVDQETAITAVIHDMRSKRPMDRLVCGDVGFGKTEVAMRAAFIAVTNNKQVILLVPTTLLAQQHFESFSDRFADWPVKIDVLSRFKATAEQKSVIQQVKAGQVDILIGTHKLLHTDINYSELGLLIIDEEHRFGVRQKEKLKALRKNVDILTLTATPIPRTLNMALASVRDLSLIVTPPAKRLSVKTFVREAQDSVIKEAVSRELLRGGQVFYLHNEVHSIERAAKHLQELIPQARICMAHGQMPERELEKVMASFYHKRHNILVCSTIIETGIDIPSANTILINRADKFGLAQLHQLRGRVGRSHHQAYAYLLLPPQVRLKADAQKRIDAIQSATNLGAGFTLASHDLEIRGAGELLGDEQSGHMQKIGFALYSELLEEAVSAIRAGKNPSIEAFSNQTLEVNLRIPALIPEKYLPDVHTRLIMYKRIASADSNEELEELQVEMVDRFGLMPKSLSFLFQQTKLRLKAATFGIKKIDANANSGRIEFKKHTDVDPSCLVQMIQTDPQNFRLTSGNQLHFSHLCSEPEEKIRFIGAILDKLSLIDRQIA